MQETQAIRSLSALAHEARLRVFRALVVAGPEGLTPSRLYINGTMRSWVHYLGQRLHPSTQKEHRILAESILAQLRTVAPVTMGAFFPEIYEQAAV